MPKGSAAGLLAKKSRVRVWWPPTSDSKRSGFSGAYWPGDLLSKSGDRAVVKYDNGDKETVLTEYLQPRDPPAGFGKETRVLQIGEFVEVHNNSKTDPAEWVGVVRDINKKEHICTISYPFHSALDENVEIQRLRRARVWDFSLSQWSFVQPFQQWEGGEVTSPTELFSCNEKALFTLLAGDRKKVRVQGRGVAKAAEEQSKLPSPTLTSGKREAEVETVKLPAKRHKAGTGSTDRSQLPSASSEGALAAAEARKAVDRAPKSEKTSQQLPDVSPEAAKKPGTSRECKHDDSAPEIQPEIAASSHTNAQSLPGGLAALLASKIEAFKEQEAAAKRAAEVSPEVQRNGRPAEGFAERHQRSVSEVHLSTLAGRRIPSEWIPAPNIGPESYIVPSTNPDEPPDIIRLISNTSPPKEPQPLQPADSRLPVHQPLPDLGMGWESVAAPPASRRPKTKDPNFPKHPNTAHTFFLKKYRPEVKAKMASSNQGSVDSFAVTNRLATMWREVTPEEKAEFQALADADKARFEEDLKNYVPTPGFNAKGEKDFPEDPDSVKIKATAKKDKDAPKRPRSSYILFKMDFRKHKARIGGEGNRNHQTEPSSPSLSRKTSAQLDFFAATAAAAAAWREASAETRKRFETEAALEKEAYAAAMRVYKRQKEEQAKKERVEQRRAADLLRQVGNAFVGAPPPAPQNALNQQRIGHPVAGCTEEMAAGDVSTTLQQLDLETAKTMLKKERLHPDAYYMLVDAWRHDSPRLENALRSFNLHVNGRSHPDYKAFLVGIFGLEIMRPLMANSNPPPPPAAGPPQQP